MNQELVLTLFNRISDAPGAIAQLRQFIFQLAVRGKLTSRDPRDESASELLKRLRAAKVLRTNKGGKQEQPSTLIDAAAMPIRVPRHWVWLRLSEIGMVSGGMTPSKNRQDFWDGRIDWFSPKDIKSSELVASEMKITAAGVRETGLQLYPPGCLFIVARSGILKRTFPVSINRVEATANQDLKVVSPFLPGMEQFLQIMFRGLTDFILSTLVKTGTTVQSLKYEEFESQPFPLPPLAEQQRIVAKVDELMSLCDRLEALQAARRSRQDRFAAASLFHLNDGGNAEDLSVHVRFCLAHIPRLTTYPQQIGALRQAILNLAVRGRLVAQRPDDEPASELLKRIQAEKTRLVREKQISREKPPIPAQPDDLGFDLRPGWAAARMSQLLVELQTGPFGSSLHESDYQKGGVPVINPASIRNGRVTPIESMAVGPAVLERLATFKLRAGDIVMARRGEMGRCAVVTDREDGWLCGTGSLILRLPDFLYPPFVVALIGSPFVREYLGGSSVGATMQNLNQSILLNLIIGLPPLAEQRRIVAKVDELMAICDGLEAQLNIAQTERRRLLEAVLDRARNDGDVPVDNVKDTSEKCMQI
jgi:type I restriction enzyme S subunit